jgi:hypothetical protein
MSEDSSLIHAKDSLINSVGRMVTGKDDLVITYRIRKFVKELSA